MNILRYVSMIMITFSSLSIADQGNTYYNEVEAAKNSIGSSLNSSTFKNFNQESYCADASCVAEMNNPSQQKYFGNDNAMEDEAMMQLGSDPNANNIVDGFNNRPKYDIDPNDPALRRAKGYMDDSYNISHGISSKYHDCDDGSVCTFDPVQPVCQVPTHASVSCFEEPYVTDTTITSGSKTYYGNSMFTPLTLTLPPGVTEITKITLPKIAFCQSSGCLSTGSATFRFNHSYSHARDWNHGRGEFYVDHGCKQSGNGYSCLFRFNPFSLSLNLAVQNTLTISIDNDLALMKGPITVHYKQRTHNIEWRKNCDGLLPECQQTQKVCVEPGETRYLNGLETYLSCWKYELKHQCELDNTCDTYLPPARRLAETLNAPSPDISECSESSRTCSVRIFGVCLAYDVTLSCKEKRCEQIGLTCGQDSFCLDGDCYNPPLEGNEDFDESASALAALGAAAENLNADTLTIFTGKPAFCDKKPVGLSDCCSDDGWGNDLGLTACTEEEKGLGQAKKDGLTIELGEFCAEDVLGVCIRKKKSYCQFDSKMSRIVQEQGRGQLGLNFGSKESPNCDGITPEQMQQLDFSTIDFSDFYADMQNNMELPDMEQVQESIVDKFEDMKK